jgi:WD40 repeat protein/tRNA A-37 threonylcarbamoyl transferase component Bud32
MNDPKKPRPPAEASSRQSDILRRSFEEAWQAARTPAERPRIEDFLGTTPEPARSHLLRTLLAVELVQRRRLGEQPEREEYRPRFPEHLTLLREVFRDVLWSGPAIAEPETLEAVPPPAVGQQETLAPEESPSEKMHRPPLIPGYELLRVLGRGGMGVVYKARQVKLQRIVALKMLLAGEFAEEQTKTRFCQEAETLGRLQHPNIVQIHEVGEVDGKPFFSLEYISGGSLADLLSGKPIPPRRAARLVETLARAMHAAHQHDIVHRDLKPANVLLTEDGVLKITDFGLAKQLDHSVAHTQSGAIMGTPSYMAPEQAAGKSKEIGPAADIYALGAILYEMLTGKPPFQASMPLDTLLKVLSEEPVPPHTLHPATPPDLETICLKCLHKDPAKRYKTARALAEDLRRFQAGEPIRARKVGPLERMVKWVKRRPSVAGMLVAAVLVVVGLAILVWQTEEARRASDQAAAEAAERARLLEEKRKEEQRLATARYANQLRDVRDALKDEDPLRARQALDLCPKESRGWEHDYLLRLCSSDLLRAHTSPINAATFSPDGRLLATASADRTVKVWDPGTGRLVITLHGLTQPVTRVLFSPVGARILTLCLDRSARLWDLATGENVRTVQKPSENFVGLAFGPDAQPLACTWEGVSLKVWDVNTGRLYLTVPLQNSVRIAAISPDGSRLAATCWDSNLHAWDLKGKELFKRPDLGNFTSRLLFSPNGKRLVTVEGQKVRIRDGATGEELQSFVAQLLNPAPLAYSPDGQRLAGGLTDSNINVWDASSGKLLSTMHAQAALNNLADVALAADGRLAAAGRDGTVRIWHTSHHEGTLLFQLDKQTVSSLVYSVDGQRLAGITSAGEACLWNSITGQKVRTLPEKVYAQGALAFSPDGKTLAGIVSQAGIAPNLPQKFWEVKTWDVSSGKPVRTFKGHLGVVTCLAYHPDGKHLATGSGDRLVKVWDVATGEVVFNLGENPSSVVSVAFSPDGKYLVSSGGGLKVWEAATGKEVRSIHASAALRNVVFGPRGNLLTGAAPEDALRIWDVTTGQELFVLKGHASAVTAAVFSPDGKRVVSAGKDGRIKIWDAATGEYLLTLKAHTAEIDSLVFSPDGKRLASAGKDHTVRLWEAAPFVQETLQLPHLVNTECWAIVRRADATAEEYRKALDRMNDCWRQEPMNGYFLNTLGVAQYRAGDYEEALRTLLRSHKINVVRSPGGIPADLAFLAMLYHRLPEHKLMAYAMLKRAREAVQKPQWNNPESRDFVREAERVLTTPIKAPKK